MSIKSLSFIRFADSQIALRHHRIPPPLPPSLISSAHGNALPEPHHTCPNPDRVDRYWLNGCSHGLPSPLRRLLPHHLRSHSVQSPLPPIIAKSPFEVAKSCDVVFTIVGHPPDVRQVILETNGVLWGLNPNGVTVDMTTNLPSLAREISSAARARDCWAVDAPVSGADVGAREGKLGIFAGGDAGVVKWLTPLFDIMGKVTYMGEAGCGQSCKIGNNIVGGVGLVGLSEGLVFAERAGLDLKQFLEAVRGGAAGSTLMELFGEKMIGRDMRPGGFAEYLVKDLGMGVDVVEEEEDERVVVLPGAALSKQMYSAMVANGDGKLWHSWGYLCY